MARCTSDDDDLYVSRRRRISAASRASRRTALSESYDDHRRDYSATSAEVTDGSRSASGGSVHGGFFPIRSSTPESYGDPASYGFDPIRPSRQDSDETITRYGSRTCSASIGSRYSQFGSPNTVTGSRSYSAGGDSDDRTPTRSRHRSNNGNNSLRGSCSSRIYDRVRTPTRSFSSLNDDDDDDDRRRRSYAPSPESRSRSASTIGSSSYDASLRHGRHPDENSSNFSRQGRSSSGGRSGNSHGSQGRIYHDDSE
jgi:hypothetical protein